MNRFLSAAALAALASTSAFAGEGACKAPAAPSAAAKDIVDTAVGAGSFNTLVAAVKAAGLVETLKGPGPFTVFAPTDEAFAKVPADVLKGLLADKAALTKVLTYHVVAGKATAADVAKTSWATTVEGQSVWLRSTGDSVMVDDARVVKADILCSNGVIHVIDTVLMPRKDLVDTAVAAGSFKTLVAAVEAAGLVDTLKGPGPFTVFAPTDEAFAKLPAGTVEALLKDKAKLAAILTYHVVAGRTLSSDLPTKAIEVATVEGRKLTIVRGADGNVTVDGATVVKADIVTSNGVIHVIDTVVLPK
jgi:transforming growth factor-beta-induced protein